MIGLCKIKLSCTLHHFLCTLSIDKKSHHFIQKNVSDEALKNSPSIKSVIVQRSGEKEVNMTEGRDFWFESEIKKVDDNCLAEKQGAEDPLFMASSRCALLDRPKT